MLAREQKFLTKILLSKMTNTSTKMLISAKNCPCGAIFSIFAPAGHFARFWPLRGRNTPEFALGWARAQAYTQRKFA